MNTRSSTRLAESNQTNFKSNRFELNNTKQTRQPKPDIYFSDDSDDDHRTLNKLKPILTNKKSAPRKTYKRTIKPKIIDSDDSSNECKIIDVKKEHSSQDNLVKSSTKKCVAKLNNDTDECKNLNNPLSTPRKQKLRSSDYDLTDISCVSPPKLRKAIEDAPQTPQHHKTQQDEVQTPSRLFLKLNLTSPTHRKGVEEKTSVLTNRKELFKGDLQNIFLENETEKIPKKAPTVYQNARKALHSTFPTDMPGREQELKELRNFMETCIESRMAGSLYISGPPGTGKTAALNTILEGDKMYFDLKKVYVNCTAIKSPTAIYSRIVKELGIKTLGKSEKDYLTGIENYLKKQMNMILLVLDEIDQLESKNQSILYTIFEWPSKPNSPVILVGIANALDLTDRKLPRLYSTFKLKPKLMHFAPYTKQQIVQILSARLKSVGATEIFSAPALQMLAGKVAAVSGDVRRALDIGRRGVELVDEGKSEIILKPIQNLTADKEENSIENKPKAVELKHVMSVLNSVYGTSQNLMDDGEETFPLQQKIIVCSLILILKKARNKDVTVGKLHEVYKRVCKKRNILSVDQAEFVGLCSLIETRGIIRVIGKKEPRMNKVSLEWDEEEVASALKDKQLMSTILQDESCLGKM